MALAPSWDTVAAPGLRTPEIALPTRPQRAVPLYPAGRHRGERRSWWRSLFAALTASSGYTGRHRTGQTSWGYAGRHRA